MIYSSSKVIIFISHFGECILRVSRFRQMVKPTSIPMNETWQRLWTQETVVQKNCLESIPSISELFIWAIRIDLVKNDLNCFKFISALKPLTVTSQSYRYHMASMKRRPQAGRQRCEGCGLPIPWKRDKTLGKRSQRHQMSARPVSTDSLKAKILQEKNLYFYCKINWGLT